MQKAAIIIALIILMGSIAACSNSNANLSTSEISQPQTTLQEESKESKDNTLTISSVQNFSGGFAWVRLSDSNSGQLKYACIDTNGKIQFFLDDVIDADNIPSNYIKEFNNGYCVVTDHNDTTYIINSGGKIIASSEDNEFDNVLAYGDGYFAVENYKNDLHSVEYTVSILDENGEFIVKDWITSENKINLLGYYGESVFVYTSRDGYYENNYDCYNASTKQSFALKDCNLKSQFNDNKAVIYHYFDNYYELVSSNGKTEKLDCYQIDGCSDRAIFDNGIVFQKANDDNLYLYDILSGKTSALYTCGNGIKANVSGYNNGIFLISVSSSNHSGGKTDWIVLIDKQGNNLFEPIEGKAESFSCDRIIANNKIYDTKGNIINFPDNYEISTKYNDNYLCVKSPDYNYSGYENYVDINGNLLFNGNIEY